MSFTTQWLRFVGRQAHTLGRQIALGGGQLEGADVDRFSHEVEHRLAIGARDYGDSYRTRPIAEIEAELLQEPPDIAAWALLYGDRRGLQAHRCQMHLANASALAAMAQEELRAAIAAPDVDD